MPTLCLCTGDTVCAKEASGHGLWNHELGAVRGTAITTLETSAPGQIRSRERRPRAVAARAEEPLADRRPCMTSKRPELSLLRAIRRSFVSIRRVVEVRLDRGFCATEPTRDVSDREALLVAVVARERDRPATLVDAVQSHHASDDTVDRRRQTEDWPVTACMGHDLTRVRTYVRHGRRRQSICSLPTLARDGQPAPRPRRGS